VPSEDYIYIGSDLPFNHVYLKFGTTVNSEASTISEVAYWSGNNDWRAAVEVIDETSVAGATFAQDGYISWVTDKDYSWREDDTNRNQQQVDGLTSVNIYDKYWVRIKFSADLTADVILSWSGNLFSNDDDLGSEYPDLVRSAMTTALGFSNYEEQSVRAAKIIIKDLIQKSVMIHSSQILDKSDMMLASVSKVAELIYGMLGDDYRDDKVLAQTEYNKRLVTSVPKIDEDGNARVDKDELRIRPGRIIR